MHVMKVGILALTFAMAACGPGERGPAGPTGPQGPQGAAGPGNNAATVHVCDGEVPTSPGAYVFAEHIAWTYPDGSMLVMCAVYGSDSQTNVTVMYRASDIGAKAASCRLTFDAYGAGTGGGFEFLMNASRTVSQVELVDSDNPYDGGLTSMTCVKR